MLNGEVITQSPAAKSFQAYLLPPENGSWKAAIGIFFGAALTVGVASKDSVLGYLAVAALDYVIQESLGFKVSFDEMLGPQIEKAFDNNQILKKFGEERFDSLIEKIEPGLRQCHRPIAFSESALNAQISWKLEKKSGLLNGFFDSNTFEYISRTIRASDLVDLTGVVSSYNMNTFKGRLYAESMERTILFELSNSARSSAETASVAGSLYENTVKLATFTRKITLRGFKNESVNNRLKSIYVVGVNPAELLVLHL